MYTFQNAGDICILGDFNARISDASIDIEGVDLMTPWTAKDETLNTFSDVLIDFQLTQICVPWTEHLEIMIILLVFLTMVVQL